MMKKKTKKTLATTKTNKQSVAAPQPLGWDKVINERYDPAVPITGIRPHPKNPRAGDVGAISQSIVHNGFYGACVVQQSTGYILVGNHRHQAAAHEGAETLPVIWVDCDDEVARRILVSDNRANDLAGYDNQALAELLESIRSEQGDFTGTLYDQEDYDRLLSDLANGYVSGLSRDEIKNQEFASPNATVKTGKCDDDETPEPEEQPVSRLGDLWICGEHRVLCGDSTDKEQVARLMDGQKADMVFCDPPYNIASENKGFAAGSNNKQMGVLMESKWDKNFDPERSLECLRAVLAEDVTVYITTSHHLAPVFWQWMKEWADHYSWCVWAKPNPMPSLSKRHWTWSAELICYATRGKHTFNFPEDGHALSVWTFTKSAKCDLHPTMKPVNISTHAITHSSRSGDSVLDLFGGSGSTLIACEKHSRRARLMEIDPKYCDVIAKRFQVFSGQAATLESSDRTFDEIALERRASLPATV